MKTRRNEVSQVGPPPVKVTHKRKKGAESRKPDDAEDESRPVKRRRGGIQPREVVSRSASPENSDTIQTKTATTARTAKRYGKKGRTSSPAPVAVTGIDYDELPGLTVPNKSEKSSPVQQRRPAKEAARKASTITTGMGKTRASAMRRKDEKLETLAVVKVKTEKKSTKTRAKRALNVDDDIKIASVKTLDPPENKRLTRSKLNKVCLFYIFRLR
jgi:hypothetical protein